MSMPRLFNWLALVGLPGRQHWYTGSSFTALSPNGVDLFCAIQGINKNKNPERHELLILTASMVTGAFALVERYVQRTDFEGHLGKPTLIVLPNNQLHVTLAMDFDKATAAMFPPYSFGVDGNQREDVQTYKV